jgi:hypothetical protein
MTPTLRGMTLPVIKSLGHLPSASFLRQQEFTSFNDSEALMTDNNNMVWTTTKQSFEHLQFRRVGKLG